MSATKVISARIPMELYEDILKDAVFHNLMTSDWLILQLRFVMDLDSELRDVLEHVADCRIPRCPMKRAAREYLNDHYSTD